MASRLGRLPAAPRGGGHDQRRPLHVPAAGVEVTLELAVQVMGADLDAEADAVALRERARARERRGEFVRGQRPDRGERVIGASSIETRGGAQRPAILAWAQ